MACGYCEKIEGLPKVDHVLNTAGKQVYRCPMCTEYIVEIKISTSGGVAGAPAGAGQGASYNWASLAKAMNVKPKKPTGAFGVPAPGLTPAATAGSNLRASVASSIKETKNSDYHKVVYVGYDPAGIERMI